MTVPTWGIEASFVAHVGSDPDLSQLPDGTAVLRVGVAVLEQKTETPTWVRITRFGDDAPALRERLRRGSRLYAEGRLTLGHWTAGDGSQRSGLNLNATLLQPLGLLGRRVMSGTPAADPSERCTRHDGVSTPTTTTRRERNRT